MTVKSKEEIQQAIDDIEAKVGPDDEYCYLDEEDQIIIRTLNWVLNNGSL